MTTFHGTNQDVINVFFAAFGEPDYFDVKMVNAGLASLAQNRQAAYTGPAVEDLPNLSDADRQALLQVLAQPVNWPEFGFTADKTSIQAGDPVKFSWKVSDGVEGVYFWNGLAFEGVGGTDSRTVQPQKTSDYRLKVVARHGQEFISTPIQVVVTARSKPCIGVNVISNGDAARAAIAAGCKFISVTFNPDLARELKQQHPDVLVASRANFYKVHLPSLAEFRDKHGYALSTPGMIVYGVNENDQIGDGGQSGERPDEIRKRSEWDAQMWQVCKDAGVIFAGGGYAMGGPNIVVPVIRAAMKQYYAPLFNAGMWFNQHMYSGNDHSNTPIKTRIFNTTPFTVTWDGITATGRRTWWLEERPRFYLQWCGFDGDKSTFISDEIGVDNPGPFSDFGFTAQEVGAWCARWQAINSEPMPDGAHGAYKVIGGALFQSGDPGTWKAFEVNRYFDGIKAAGVW